MTICLKYFLFYLIIRNWERYNGVWSSRSEAGPPTNHIQCGAGGSSFLENVPAVTLRA